MLEILVVGTATAVNFGMLKYKYDNNRQQDLILDVSVLIILSYMFGGTATGLGAAMVASFLVSIYLLKTTGPGTTKVTGNNKQRTTMKVNW